MYIKIKTTLFRLAIINLLLNGCTSDHEEIPILEATYHTSHFAEEDGKGLYLGRLSDMVYHEEKIYMADKDFLKIWVFDKDLNYLQSIGQFGDGPDEFSDLASLGIFADSILFVHDSGHSRIRFYNIYDKYRPMGEYNLNFTNDIDNFYFEDSLVYFSAPIDIGPLVVHDRKNNNYITHGEWLESKISTFQRNYRSVGHIYKSGQYFLFIRPTEPIIKVYNKNFGLVNELSLEKVGILSETLKKAEEIYLNHGQKSLVDLYNDIFISDDGLFLSIYHRTKEDGNERLFVDKILKLKFDKASGNLTINAIIDLSKGKGYYSEFVLFDNNIFAFDVISNKIDAFTF